MSATGPGAVELRLPDGAVLASLAVHATGGPYDFTTVKAELLLSGVTDLEVGVSGAVRLAGLSFS
ncbi:carbohydrate-binding protein [Peterkaempfera griseoplana]|uniref:hypothetical protein n=1 Tax=Peterkaempfera griseoplana TaxID=66896 RepID=UPI002B0020AD|nr:hypothetical protein [Peterkaempfera griseoplana]